jgi:hypothetical protein
LNVVKEFFKQLQYSMKVVCEQRHMTFAREEQGEVPAQMLVV